MPPPLFKIHLLKHACLPTRPPDPWAVSNTAFGDGINEADRDAFERERADTLKAQQEYLLAAMGAAPSELSARLPHATACRPACSCMLPHATARRRMQPHAAACGRVRRPQQKHTDISGLDLCGAWGSGVGCMRSLIKLAMQDCGERHDAVLPRNSWLAGGSGHLRRRLAAAANGTIPLLGDGSSSSSSSSSSRRLQQAGQKPLFMGPAWCAAAALALPHPALAMRVLTHLGASCRQWGLCCA
jgi:hypothetical protein